MTTRILIADDDAPIRMLLRRLFERHASWEVYEAEDGSEAVEKTAQLAPNLVILDLAMPAMNGLQIAREIGKVNPGLPMLLVSNGMDAPVKEASSVPEWQVQDQPLRMKGSVQDEGYDHRY